MSAFDPPSLNHERAGYILDSIARSLGCSVGSFSDRGSHELSETLELLNLWLAIDDRQDRMKALALLRNTRARMRAMDGIAVPAPGEPVALSHAMQIPDRDS